METTFKPCWAGMDSIYSSSKRSWCLSAVAEIAILLLTVELHVVFEMLIKSNSFALEDIDKMFGQKWKGHFYNVLHFHSAFTYLKLDCLD